MSTEKNEQWLDELIARSINTTKPEFDAEEWKMRHPEALQSLLSRRAKPAASHQPGIRRLFVAHPVMGLAAAAAVTIVVTGLFLFQNGRAPNRVTLEPQLATQSPTEIVSMMSLRMAYQRGGWDALDRQFRDTLDTLGPGPSSLSMQQLLEGSKAF